VEVHFCSSLTSLTNGFFSLCQTVFLPRVLTWKGIYIGTNSRILLARSPIRPHQLSVTRDATVTDVPTFSLSCLLSPVGVFFSFLFRFSRDPSGDLPPSNNRVKVLCLIHFQLLFQCHLPSALSFASSLLPWIFFLPRFVLNFRSRRSSPLSTNSPSDPTFVFMPFLRGTNHCCLSNGSLLLVRADCLRSYGRPLVLPDEGLTLSFLSDFVF